MQFKHGFSLDCKLTVLGIKALYSLTVSASSFFILCNLLIEVFLIRAHRRNAVNEPRHHHHHTKERPDSTISGETGTTAPPPVAAPGGQHMGVGGQHMGGEHMGTMGTQQTHMAAPATTTAV